jgi:hypothetical protein
MSFNINKSYLNKLNSNQAYTQHKMQQAESLDESKEQPINTQFTNIILGSSRITGVNNSSSGNKISVNSSSISDFY